MSFLKILNPFASNVGLLIQDATDPNNASENWSLVVTICDKMKESDEHLRDGMRALRKRLVQCNAKTARQTLLSLLLLESCVKNGDNRLRTAVSNREFLRELVRLVDPQSGASHEVRDKVLSLIQEWRDSFAEELVEFAHVYEVLRFRGVEFPAVDLDRLAPARLTNLNGQLTQVTGHSTQQNVPTIPTRSSSLNPNAGVNAITDAMRTKLRADLQAVRQTLINFCDLINRIVVADSTSSSVEHDGLFNAVDSMDGGTTPGSDFNSEDATKSWAKADAHLQLTRLAATLKNMQVRICELMECDCVQSDADLSEELLSLNDAVCCSLTRHARLFLFTVPVYSTGQADVVSLRNQSGSVRADSQAQAKMDRGDGDGDGDVTLIDFDADIVSATPPFSLNAERTDFITLEEDEQLPTALATDADQSLSANRPQFRPSPSAMYANQEESGDQFNATQDALTARYRALNGEEDNGNQFDVAVVKSSANRRRHRPIPEASSADDSQFNVL